MREREEIVQESNNFVRPTEIYEISRVFFFPKQTRNVQGTEEFVRSVEKFENLSTRVLGSQLYVVCCAIWYHLYNFENVKNTHGGVLFLVNFTKSNTPSLVFSRFLNCTNGTKSRETPHI